MSHARKKSTRTVGRDRAAFVFTAASRAGASAFSAFALLSCALASFALVACALPRSSVSLARPDGHAVTIRALSSAAETGVIEGADGSAWFTFNPARAGLLVEQKVGVEPGAERSLAVTLECESDVPVTVTFGAVIASDIGKDGKLVPSPGKRPLAVAEGVTGNATLGICVPVEVKSVDGERRAVRGFAVSVSGLKGGRVRVSSASVGKPVSFWSYRAGKLGFVPSAAGGRIDTAELRAGNLPRALVPRDSFVTLDFAPSGAGAGTVARQERSSFRAGRTAFAVRKTPGPHIASIPAFALSRPGDGDTDLFLAPDSGCESLSGISVTHGESIPVADPRSPASPIAADPSLIVEWSRERWRRPEFEVFSWDSFLTVLIFDTADYATQDLLFKRLAFFVEKEGYRGKLLTDAELESLHAYNAHDYRAESLAAFYDAVAASGFALGKLELALRDILVREGIIVARGKGYAPGAGAILSISRESVSYLRYLFIAHEGYHGIYFVDPDFRAEVSRVYRSMDPRAIKYLQTYFTVVGSLGYDTDDSYLMENEFMGYLMQQPLDRVEAYFTGVIAERYARYGGNPELAEYVANTKAADFVRAAEELNSYVFSRWGIAGGRVGLYLPGD